MLQIRDRLILFFISWCCIPAGAGPYSDSVAWMLEDALAEEIIALEISEITTPEDFKRALEFYKQEDFRQAVEILEDLRDLNLPDGRTDFITFMIAECYRKLCMDKGAQQAYWYVIRRFPKSSKVAPAYFRILQYAYDDREGVLADTILSIFERRYKIHPLYNSVYYVVGKLYFHLERYGEAGNLLLKIPRVSSRHFQAQFLAALAFIQLHKHDKSLLILEYIRQNAEGDELIDNVNAVIGDIYFGQKNYSTALPYFRNIRKGSGCYTYAQVKMARIYLAQKEFQKARDKARPFIGKGRKSESFFEMASIMDEIYMAKGEKVKAARIKRLVHKQNINARLSFEISEELVRIYEMIRSWRAIEYYGLERGDDALIKDAEKNIKQLQNLRRKCRAVLRDIGAITNEDVEVEGLAQQRYIVLLRKELSTLEDTVAVVAEDLEELQEIAAMEEEMAKDSLAPKDSLMRKEKEAVQTWFDSVSVVLSDKKQEYEELKDIYLESGSEADRYGREMQAKYVDWAFMRYQEKKEQLAALQKELALRAEQKQDTTVRDSVTGDTRVSDTTAAKQKRVEKQEKKREESADFVSLFTAIDSDKLIKSIQDDRMRLIDHIAMLLDASPGSSYNPQVLFRLAELYYDEASDDFTRRLEAYEKKMEQGGDSAAVTFPEYDLSKVITIYDQIITAYPKDWLADDALFYKALALKKLGREKEACDEFIRLITMYPESEFYVEANMNIGSYYFANPSLEGGKGYKRAEEAYRRVLYYRDHPQFVHAIYHLGWCYYMQDLYDDAIAVFKYLVEEVDLDFDVAQVEDRQVVNPLMRDEAIDYIAISFDEQDDMDGAIKFLTLVGNINYAAKVFKRIGELREEDLDYTAAIKVYRRLIDEYALSSVAPDASISLIKILESTNKHTRAMAEREDFFRRYAKGTKWHTEIAKHDPAKIVEVDSITISIGLYVADALYRDAEKENNSALFQRAVDNYGRLINAYPDNPAASEALWNIAVILDTKLNKKKSAYKAYLQYSTCKDAEQERREQAALNAVAIAQSFLPSDTAATAGKMETAAVKVIEAAKNYMKLFPNGKSLADVVMSMGSVYFNRKMYANAVETYKVITKRGKNAPKFYDAGLLISKCYFGEENWMKAAAGFEKVWQESPDALQREEAYKLLLQSRFLYAKQLFDAGAFEKAAVEYATIDKKYPGSTYGDVTLFNAAEAYEKKEQWLKACQMYYELYKKYPDSKLAPDALFNAATDYEKIEKYKDAAAMYEIIVRDFPTSPKAKDALFNVGFSYEKLGKLDKMADANERYSRMFPEEKDVELMLVRSGEFYFKSEKYEKARTVYKNYISRYPKRPKTVEAYFMIGRCYLNENDRGNAVMAFEQAEAQNKRLLEEKKKVNNYYAAEAAFSLGQIKQKAFSRIDFSGAADEIKERQKQKAEELSRAIQAYQRVIQYKSERMFEAAFHIGEMYEEYGRSWGEQKMERMDPVKMAVAKKEINLAAAKLLKRSFDPYGKVIELAKGLDSLDRKQQRWVDAARVKLIENYSTVGEYMVEAVTAMAKAPIPDEIKKQPLYLFQYKKQLLETIEPLKVQVRDYYRGICKEVKGEGFPQKAVSAYRDRCGRTIYLIPRGYDELAEDILTGIDELPKRMDEEEREELVFQFEDLVFELQDKALFAYEDGLEMLQEENLSGTKWHTAIMERLARLSPETYGKSFYLTQTVVTDGDWIFHTDSVRYWNAADPFGEGWKQIRIVHPDNTPNFTTGKPQYVWGDAAHGRIFLWRNVFLNGVPRDGAIYLACHGRYRLYCNEKLLMSDTSGVETQVQVDSITGITSFLKGGDNIVALEIAEADSMQRGIACVVTALVDTSQHFTSRAIEPRVKKLFRTKKAVQDSLRRITAMTVPDSSARPQQSHAQQFKNKGEMIKAVEKYQKRAQRAETELKKERLAIQKLHIKDDALTARIRKVTKEIQELKKKRSGMTREK